MAMLPTTSSSLELTIGISSSTSLPFSVRDLDINQVPLSIEGDGFNIMMNNNSNHHDHHHHQDHQEWMMITTTSMELDEEEISNINGSGPPRKKLRLTKEQSLLLEESFREHHTLNPKQKEALAMQLNLRPRQVEVWFQNRRARSKLKQTEMECEYLKRWFGSLTEQNRRLQREVEDLRSMKVGPPTVLSPHTCKPLAASTLTMCPRCQRVTTRAAATADKKPGAAALSPKAAEKY